MGKRDAAAVAAEKTIEFAERAGDAHERGLAMGDLVGSLLDGSTHALDAIRRSEALLERAGDDRSVVAHIQRKLGMLHSMRGNKADAWRLVESSVNTYEDLGIPLGLAAALGFERAALHMASGDFAAAEQDRRYAVELLQEIGEKGLLSTLSALLAATLYLQGEDEEAERFLEVSEASAGKHDWISQMFIKEVHAELHARAGEFDDALALSREALAEVEGTDDIEGEAWQRMRLAKLLTRAGRPSEAAPLLREAKRLFEAKGHLVGTDLAVVELRELDRS
jgi:tetratricopeptide (TPR) repeat protein